MSNKVSFGIKSLYICTYTVSEGKVTLGTPDAIPGAVSLTNEPQGDNEDFYADNKTYYTSTSDTGDSGTVTVAEVPDDVKTKYFGWGAGDSTTQGGIMRVRGKKKPQVCLMFEADGDVEHRRAILYNVTLKGIKQDHNTAEDKTKPDTASFDYTALGDELTDVVMAVFRPDDAAYSKIFTAPVAPTLAAES